MKKVISTLVAAIVTVAFAGVVSASDPSKVETETTTTNPACDVTIEKMEVREKSGTEKAADMKASAEKAADRKAAAEKAAADRTTTTTTTTPTAPAMK